MEDKRKELTPVQSKFVDEYLKDASDGGAAYCRASGGTNKKSGTVQASKLLKLPKIQNALKDRAKEVLGAMEARILQNIEFWLNIRDGKVEGMGKGKLISLKEVKLLTTANGLDEDLLDDLEVYEVPLGRIADRMKASEYLGKYMQMFIEKKEISADIAVRIVDDI